MSSRPAPPPPIARWPFYAGAFVLIGIAFYLLLTAGRPPAVPPLIVSMFCLGGSIVLCVIPTAMDNERRLRLAEAAVREAADAQLRRLAQIADQLTHVVSRSQSTEEQAGRALGTLEEVAERMVAQAEELAAALARAGEREQADRAEEIQRLVDERDQKLTALEIRLNAISLALGETQAGLKRATVSTARSVDALAVRLDEIGEEWRAALADRPEVPAVALRATPPSAAAAQPPPVEAPARTPEDPAHADVDRPAEAPTPPAEDAVAVPASGSELVDAPEPAAVETPVAEPSAPAVADEAIPEEVAVLDSTAVEAPAENPEPAHPVRAPRKARHARGIEKPAETSAPPTPEPTVTERILPNKPTAPLELALEGMPEPRPVMRLNRREPAGSTSLVATAYIGIGNKLYLRGDGPGLSWERGTPMQFLAIGKWGWTTTDASVPVTCRVYRNDDTPMLEENIVIDPGTKAEITPKF